MSGSYLHRSWEVSSVPDGILSGGAGKGNRNPATNTVEKSDAPVVPEKSPNKGQTSFLLNNWGQTTDISALSLTLSQVGQLPLVFQRQ